MGIIVVGGVIEKDGKFLLVQEAKEEFRGKWNLPAGQLDANETLFDGAKREIFEECGCRVELTGVLQIGNKLIENDSLVSIIFSTKLLEENIIFNQEEILDVKWFTYEEILNMKDELRSYGLIDGAISAFVNNKIFDIDIVRMI
ncbi:MAG: NUDIX domain-containing protein [Bacilli bacterium]|nr:NUDIX domain-containing protein [Bacilli bacterium]